MKRKTRGSRNSRTGSRGRPRGKGALQPKLTKSRTWEEDWKRLPLEDVRLICQHIWPRLEFKTWGNCLDKLSKDKMFANETVTAWVQAGSKDPSIFSKEILQVKPEKMAKRKDSDLKEKESSGELKLLSNAVIGSEEKVLGAEPNGASISTSAGITQMALDTPRPTSDLISPDPIIKKKQRVLIQDAEEDEDEGISSEDTRGRYSPAAPKISQLDVEELAEYLEDLGFKKSRRRSLDDAKVVKLKALIPENIALMDPLEKKEKNKLFQDISFFDDILPPALDKDWTSLSRGLSFGKRKKIEWLFQTQVKAREKIRFTLQQLHNHLDLEYGMEEQSADFRAWQAMLYLLIDDMAVAVKLQQKIILENHGYGALLQRQGNSIIPLEIKEQLKQIKDFDLAFQRKKYFSGFGNSKGRGGSRFFSPSWKRGQKRSFKGRVSSRPSSRQGAGRGSYYSVFSAGRQREFGNRSSRGGGRGTSNNTVHVFNDRPGIADEDDFFAKTQKKPVSDFSNFRGRPRGGGHGRT